MDKCKIAFISKFRNGYPKYWCYTHFALVSVKKGESAPFECVMHDKPRISEDDKYELNPEDWDGGVALWGSLDPVYNTSTEPNHQPGIHLHARMEESGAKQIDYTFKIVDVKTPTGDLFGKTYLTLNTEIAHAYTASMVFGKEMKCLKCPHCEKPHIDSDFYAVTYHRKHMCTYCGRDFVDSEKSISNPVIEIQRVFKSAFNQRTIRIVDEVLDIQQKDYPGGIQIWGSNPAIIWTAKRDEEAGVHVHLFKELNSHKPTRDDTFGKLIIDGVELNGTEIRFLMVQQSLSHLAGKILSINCPECSSPHCDRGDAGVRPHQHHLCEYCGEEFTSEIKCVGNPVVEKLQQLRANYEALQK